MPDWKGERPDKIQGFRLKSFKDVHEALATVLNECIREGDVPGRLVEGKTQRRVLKWHVTDQLTAST